MTTTGAPPAEGDVGRRTAAGVLWITAQRWVVRLLGFVTIALLTRMLSPADFGTVAAASTVLPFFFLLADLGFATYIVQVDDADQDLVSSGFWFSALAGLVLCGTLIVAAPAFGGVFQGHDVVPVIRALSSTVLFTALGSVPTALLRRSMRFAAIAVQGTVAALVAQVIAIAMTLAGLGVWALVGQTVSSSLLGCILAWVAARWRPSMRFVPADFVTMARYGSQVLGVEFVAMARAWAEAAIIANVLGMAALGFMNIAQRLVQVVQDLTGGALIPVAVVAFAKVRGSEGRIRTAYLRALRLTYATLALPLMLVAVAATLVMPLVFGDGWSSSYRLAELLAVAGILTVGASLDQALFYGLGRPGTWFVYAVVVDALTVATTWVMAPSGLVAIVLGFLVLALVATLVRVLMVSRIVSVSVREGIVPLAIVSVIVLATGATGRGVLMATAGLPPILALMAVGTAVLAAYVVAIRIAAPAVLEELGRAALRSAKVRRLLQAAPFSGLLRPAARPEPEPSLASAGAGGEHHG